jgi:uncharacterized phosphosugar-binding protein
METGQPGRSKGEGEGVLMDYFEVVIQLLEELRHSQAEAVEQAAQAVAGAIENDHLVYVFGASHASILAQEAFYRAGGLVPVNPILAPGLTTDVRPVTLTSRLERLPGLGRQILAETAVGPGDVLFVHSVSGRNAVAIEVAQAGKERGAWVIAITSLTYSKSVQSRTEGLPRLFEVADLVLDNGAPVGDAAVELPGLPQKVGPVSTVTGVALLQSTLVRASALLLEHTGEAPVFWSANLDGGDEHNQMWLDQFRGRLTYL